ncbi:protein CASC3 [Frankliniella occidentalis]|uniref:Protein CASC3 n=1 Tax=Frankliniella occidentalis TaxID=133901 RepID=A0A6J1SGK1_FRAOC|nr:protein CASC3 [Frankliniella occidentalis]
MSASEETVVADQQKEVDTSKDSEELSQCSNYDTPGKGSDADPDETAGENDHLSDYGEGDLDGEGPNVQPLDSSDEERVPDDDDQLDDTVESDRESVTVDDEREEGDGQESSPSKEKKLDDDEDRRNPQYIPKRGTFYEHDDRTADDMQETPSKESKIDSRDGKETGKESGRKVWKDREDRWQHDLFQETDQAPKSREELLSVYGYDIRNEEAAPKARRRRRYGRGPNKYTRSWEDEEAYSRPLSAFIVEKEAGENKKGPRKPRVLSRGGRGAGGGYRNSGNASGDGGDGNDVQKQEYPALSNSDDNGVKNGEESKVVSQPSFSSKVSGSVTSKTVAGTFNANPKEVVAPFGSQQKQQRGHQQHASSNHQTSFRQEEDQRRGWRRDSNEDGDGAGGERGNIRGRGGRPSQARNRREDDREGHRWSDHSQSNGQSRGRGGGRGGFRRGGPPPQGNQRQQREHDEENESDGGHRGYTEDVSRDMGNLSISTTHPQSSSGGDYQRRPSNGNTNGTTDRRQSMPPRMQDNAGSRPKRYSSMRARNVPETSPAQQPPVSAGYTPPTPHAYYQPGYGPAPVAGVPPGVPPGVAPMYQETPSMPAASPGHQPAVAGPPVPTMPTTLPSTIPSTIQCFPQGLAPQGIPPQGLPPQGLPPQGLPPRGLPPQGLPPQGLAQGSFIAPPPGPPAGLLPPGSFIPPVGGPAPSFVAATSPQGHVQGQYQQLAFQPYQPIAMVSGVSQPQPAELYQPQGGITYYSTQNQIIPRAAPQPRVKAAIPILPPPERSSYGGSMDEHGEIHEAVHEEIHSSSPPAEITVVSNDSNNPTS